MKNLLRAYRSGMLTKPMTPEEVEELAARSEDYTTGGLVGRRPAFTDRLAGMEMTLKYDGDGGSYPHVFKDSHSLEWTDESGAVHPEYYEAF